MKQYHGLKQLNASNDEHLTVRTLAERLMEDLQNCRCQIFGEANFRQVLLAELDLKPGTLNYERFDHRIDLVLTGSILCNRYEPLRYELQGRHFKITGRCSEIPKVCGADWYLHAGFTKTSQSPVEYKYKIHVKHVLKSSH